MAVVRVIACGNPDAGDDAAGILAVAAARDELDAVPGVEVVAQASPLDVVHLLEGADAVVVVDAIRTPSGARAPGTTVRAEAGPDGLPAEIRSSLSSHGLGLAEAFGLASAIGEVPSVVVLGVEAETSAPGAGRSADVERALPLLASMIVREARTLSDALTSNDPPEAERSPGGGSTGPNRGGGPRRR
jgi:hydrogenase maturation protease